jgi:hypothetical protein
MIPTPWVTFPNRLENCADPAPRVRAPGLQGPAQCVQARRPQRAEKGDPVFTESPPTNYAL